MEEKNASLAPQPEDLADPTQRSDSFEFGIKTIASGVSMTDYFKKKLLSLKAKNTVQEQNAPKTECAAEWASNSKSARRKRKHSGNACTDPSIKPYCSLNSVATESEECPPPALHEFGVSEGLEDPKSPTTSKFHFLCPHLFKVVHLQKVTSVVLKKVSFFTGNLSFSQDLALHHSRKPTCFLFPATSSIKPFQTVCL